MRLYVGNLAYSTREEELRALFGPYGEVASAVVITDRDSGRSKGFGFVEFSNDDDGRAAMEEVNGKEIEGRVLKVNEARPREETSRGGRSGGGGMRR